jgi:hypothetical protein
MSLVALAVLLWDKDPGSNMAISLMAGSGWW